MRIALCINGLYRNHINPGPKEIITRLHRIFAGADVYYHTWTKRIAEVPLEYHENLFYCDEPELDYHPIHDSKTDSLHGKWIPYKSKKISVHKTQHSSKQILGYADVVSKITKEYDVMVRTRWDSLLSNQINFQPYLEEALDHPVGFMTRPGRGHTVDKISNVNKNDINDDWYCYLADSLIFHAPKHFNPKYVQQLHADKNLWPAEWGWWQVLSEPNNNIHNCYHGGSIIAR